MMDGLLQDVFSGLEESSTILIEDCIDQNGRHLLKCCMCGLSYRYNTIHVVSTDHVIERWSKGLPQETLHRLKIHDFSSDILSWEKSSEHGSNLTIDSYLFQSLGNQSETAIVIDNLSTLLLRYHYTEVCRLIHQLEPHYGTICCLLHCDLHDDHVTDALHHMMSTIITATVPSDSRHDGLCTILHKRKSGKVLRKKEHYEIFEKFQVKSYQVSDTTTQTNNIQDSTIDPAANLTFDLRLTQRQKEERSQVVLPYTQVKSQILYEPDEHDDLDDSDPDDDLNI